MTTTRLPVDVEVLGPELRVHDRAGEVLEAGQQRVVAALVVVVAGARVEEPAGHRLLADLAVLAGDLERRASTARRRSTSRRRRPGCRSGSSRRCRAWPRCAGRSDRIDGPSAIGEPVPRLEGEAEGEHVGVRAHPGVAEQVPRPADGVAGLEDRVRAVRALGLQVVARPDARQPGPDDDDVHVLDCVRHSDSMSTGWALGDTVQFVGHPVLESCTDRVEAPALVSKGNELG